MGFLFVDKILQLSPGAFTQGIKQITADEAYLTQDAQGQYCFIPSLVGEALGQLAAWNVMQQNDFTKRPVAGIVSRACMYRPVYVGETVLLASTIDGLDEEKVHYHSEARVQDTVVFRIEGALGPLLPMDDFIDRETVCAQFTAIYRPNDTTDASTVASVVQPALNPTPMCFDRILEWDVGARVVAEKQIDGDAPYFMDHFPNQPVLPMTVLLACKHDLLNTFLADTVFDVAYQLTELRKIKMNAFVKPGDRLVSQLTVKQRDKTQLVVLARSDVNGKRVCVLEMVMTAL